MSTYGGRTSNCSRCAAPLDPGGATVAGHELLVECRACGQSCRVPLGGAPVPSDGHAGVPEQPPFRDLVDPNDQPQFPPLPEPAEPVRPPTLVERWNALSPRRRRALVATAAVATVAGVLLWPTSTEALPPRAAQPEPPPVNNVNVQGPLVFPEAPPAPPRKHLVLRKPMPLNTPVTAETAAEYFKLIEGVGGLTSAEELYGAHAGRDLPANLIVTADLFGAAMIAPPPRPVQPEYDVVRVVGPSGIEEIVYEQRPGRFPSPGVVAVHPVREGPAVTRADVYRATLRHLFAPVADLLYDDESVTEVLINGPHEVYFERGGALHKTDRRFPDAAALDAAVCNLAEYVGRRLDAHTHSMDARLPEPEQFRVHAIAAPASRRGTCVSIRKFARAHRSLDALTADGTLSAAAAEYLALAVRTHRNVLVSGGTGAGKTTLLNALSCAIPDGERVVVIEDASELRLQNPHTLYLEVQPPDPKGKGGATVRDLFVDSLRMRPDRIIVGEVRRGEAIDLVQSMLSGHDGAVSTIHASSPRLALVRLETLCMRGDTGLPIAVARTQVASAIHVVAQIARVGGRVRRVVEIAEVLATRDGGGYRTRALFRYRPAADAPNDPTAGVLAPTGRPSRFARAVRESRHAADIRLTEDLFPRPQAAPVYVPGGRPGHSTGESP